MIEKVSCNQMKTSTRIRFLLVIGAVVVLYLPAAPASVDPWVRLWPSGQYREEGEVEVTGKPGEYIYTRLGHWTFWYESGIKKEEGEFTQGTKTSEWQYWYENFIPKKKGAYDVGGKEDGPWEYMYKNGLPRKEGAYRAGLKDGLWSYWYNQVDGKEREGGYRNGLKEGQWVYWNEDGIKERSGQYVKGQKNGLWAFNWGSDGHRKSEGTFGGGLETGVWTYWERTGEKDTAWTYDYKEAVPSESQREVSGPAQALVGHWVWENEPSSSSGSQLLMAEYHHAYFQPDGEFIEVLEGGLISAGYVVEDEDSERRTILLRLSDEEGKGAIFFGLFSSDYRRMVGRYYRVDFLRGSQGGLTNYLKAVYIGDQPAPQPPTGLNPDHP